MLLAQEENGVDNNRKLLATQTSAGSDPYNNNRHGLDKTTLDISNVITQVTVRENNGPRIITPVPEKNSWKTRFQSLFCCLVPQPAYYGSEQQGEYNKKFNVPSHSPTFKDFLIGPPHPNDATKKTLVLDLDETLVHSSFKPIPNPDYILPVEIDGKNVDVYVLKRPWLDHFMDHVCSIYEVVIFTASLAKYADPLLDLLDKDCRVRWRLFREACCPYEGNYVKDLNCLGRELSNIIIIDNSPHSYVFQPMNALPIGSFIDNMDDQELLDILPLLMDLRTVNDVRPYLKMHVQLP
mmetsp:Transcript_18287/g.33344  ORF Transcript_18287/g.33344 Transcript_18287/m.33344 type:complete len:295 (-) Transcript_18287:2148-3032(-)